MFFDKLPTIASYRVTKFTLESRQIPSKVEIIYGLSNIIV